MSTLDVVAEVLREVAPRALKAREIAQMAGGLLPTTSKTPETVISRDLALDVRDRGVYSRFLRVDRGAFVLKEALATAFYSDNDSYAAAWIRNLVAAGEIAAGVVDERSIRDLKPADVASYRQFHAFSGIGIWSRALRDAGWSDDLPIWSGSPPCQPWSSAGRRGGESDDRHLWPEWFRLIRECGPVVIVGEQVASKDGYRWLDEVAQDFEGIGYDFTATELSAASVGAPHRRQRIYFVAYLGQRLSTVVREILSSTPLASVEAAPTETGLHALHAHVEDKVDPAGSPRDSDHLNIETEGNPSVVMAYARERGRKILSAPWLHARRQSGYDAARCGTVDGRDAVALPNTTGARSCDAQDVGADCGDAAAGAEAPDRRPAGDLESQRGGHADGACALPDTECLVRDEGRIGGSHGRPTVEPDGHGEADGTSVDESIGLGNSGLARGGRDTGEVSRAEGAGEGERKQARDLADEPFTPGTDDGSAAVEMVRGAADHSRDGSSARVFRPGDRIRIDGDPGWGGAVRGYWAEDIEWIYCRPEPGHQNGRWRPARAGIEPLANGPSTDLGRTRAARLRGFGNCIVLPQAVAFVEAVIEAFADAARIDAAPREHAATAVVEPAVTADEEEEHAA